MKSVLVLIFGAASGLREEIMLGPVSVRPDDVIGGIAKSVGVGFLYESLIYVQLETLRHISGYVSCLRRRIFVVTEIHAVVVYQCRRHRHQGIGRCERGDTYDEVARRVVYICLTRKAGVLR